jgi:hypothetical protein
MREESATCTKIDKMDITPFFSQCVERNRLSRLDLARGAGGCSEKALVGTYDVRLLTIFKLSFV